MNSLNLQAELTSLFEQGSFKKSLSGLKRDISAGDPKQQIVAAALFQLGRYTDCLLWCEALTPSLEGDVSFAAMHGALLRRLGRLDDAEKVFRAALNNTPSNPFLRNNFANLLIDKQAFKEAEEILESLLKENPNYEDAKVNYNRLTFQKDLADSAPKDKELRTSSAKTNIDINDRFLDPLAAAFSDEEVAIAGGVAAKKMGISQVAGLQPSDLPDRERDKELHETLSLARQTIDDDPHQAIRDCILLHES